MSSLPRLWFTAGTNAELWGSHGSYTRVPYDKLPGIDRARHDGTFAWLAEAPEVYGLQYGVDDDNPPEDEAILERLDAIVEVAKSEGLEVPKSFITLLSNRELYGRVPTCTACYIDLPERLADVEGQPGRLLRFMNDQQCCLVWCLHLVPGGGHSVVAVVPEIDGDAEGDTLEDVASFHEAFVCADEFEEFIHRFFLENVLWDVAQRPRPLSPEQRAYLTDARRARASMG